MKEIPLPMSEDGRNKKGARLRGLCSVISVCAVVFAVAAVLLLLGVLVSIIVAEFRRDDSTLCFILAGVFAGGAILFALLALLFGKVSAVTDARTLDYFERMDGEKSFFIGDGTLATFEAGVLCVHGADDRKKIRIPYADIRAYSVCTRKAPREKGEWSVVFEIPAHYLLKAGKAEKDAPPALVQTDAKERLYRTLEEHNIPLLGENPESGAENKRFAAEKKFYIPNKKKRTRALMFIGVGIAVAIAGIPVALLWDLAVGIILILFGVLFTGRSVYSLLRARALFAVYQEGIFWRESEKNESAFLKWEEIEGIEPEEREGMPLIAVRCAYGAYHFPRAQGAWEYLTEYCKERL